MKKELSVVLAAVLSFVLAVPVFSADSPETTIEQIIVTTYVEAPVWRANQKNDAHVFEYYTDNNHIAWTYTLHGTFTYDGSRSIVVSSSGSHAINDNRWTCTESGYCFGATV